MWTFMRMHNAQLLSSLGFTFFTTYVRLVVLYPTCPLNFLILEIENTRTYICKYTSKFRTSMILDLGYSKSENNITLPVSYLDTI